MIGLIISSISISIYHLEKRKLPVALEINLLATIILCLSFIVHGSPSEAYFPPFIVFLPILIASGVRQFKQQNLLAWQFFFFVLGMFNLQQIVANNFFVSHKSAISFGPAIGEQREMMAYIIRRSEGDFALATTGPGKEFASYFDGYRALAIEMGSPEDRRHGQVFYVENKESELSQIPQLNKVEFPSLDIYNVNQ